MISRIVDADRIRSIDLFKGVSARHFQILLKSASLRQVPQRSVVFKETGRPTVLHVLIEGSVEMFSERDDRRSTIAIIRSAKPCGLASILCDRNTVSARTLARSQFLVVPARLIRDLIETDIGFAIATARELAADCREEIEHLKNQGLRTAPERLAYWLLCFDEDSGGSGQFVIPCDKRTLASYLGMAPEHLSRNLAALAPAGLVVHGRRVMVNNRPALAAKAGLSLEQFAQDRLGRNPRPDGTIPGCGAPARSSCVLDGARVRAGAM
jgi:CRP/FNR family transcriptional regulator, transcriptional activator FtrB